MPKTSNILDLASSNYRISENLKVQLLGADASKYEAANLSTLNSETSAEQLSNQVGKAPIFEIKFVDIIKCGRCNFKTRILFAAF